MRADIMMIAMPFVVLAIGFAVFLIAILDSRREERRRSEASKGGK